jgi:hypothetical protein
VRNLGIQIRCLLLSTGAALVGLAIGTLIERPSPEATGAFAIGVLLGAVGFLRKPRRGGT